MIFLCQPNQHTKNMCGLWSAHFWYFSNIVSHYGAFHSMRSSIMEIWWFTFSNRIFLMETVADFSLWKIKFQEIDRWNDTISSENCTNCVRFSKGYERKAHSKPWNTLVKNASTVEWWFSKVNYPDFIECLRIECNLLKCDGHRDTQKLNMYYAHYVGCYSISFNRRA